MTEVKGHCRDCYFKRQEWSVDDGRRIVLAGNEEPTVEHVKSLRLQVDTYCDIFKSFVPLTGYCWLFEHEISI